MPEIKIDQNLCKGCYICLEVCPRKVFEKEEKINARGFQPIRVCPEKCKPCRLCEYLCPEGAITLEEAKGGPPCEASPSANLAKGGRLASGVARGGWKTVKSLIPPGRYFLSGNEACVWGAINAGCCFYAGYPITPSTEIAEAMAKELPKLGRKFIQMEDELASIMALAGASWSGVKSMTATSGPGFSLMQEGISYLLMTETPAVIINVQRAGPSTGQPTKPATGDIREARWGSHGGSQLIALCPSSVQECYELTTMAFNLSEQFRAPVIVLSDAYLAHLYEPLVVEEEVRVFDRIYKPKDPPFGPTEDFSAPSMPCFEDGEHLIVTGSTHNPWGMRSAQDPEVQENLTWHFQNKILSKKIFDAEELFLDDAGIIIVAYGSAARSAKWALKEARSQGLKVGLFRPRILWPFPSDRIREIARKRPAKMRRKFLVPEMSQGQLNYVVREKISNKVVSLARPNGQIIDPQIILKKLLEGGGNDN